MVMAGGQGERLRPLTELRPPEANGRSWYRGTADAVFQNADLIRSQDPELVLVFGADHVYTMDVRAMIDWHLKNRAEVTVSTVPFPIGEAAQFGTAGIGPDWRIREFLEKQSNPYPIPGRLGQALVSMGNYVFNADVLLEALAEDAGRTDSRHDFGRDIIPRLCSRRRVFAYDFRTNVIPGLEGPTDYWRDVGTIQSFHQANLDLINPFSRLNFSSSRWPLRPRRSTEPPARLISRLYGDFGIVKNSLVAASAVIDGGFVRDSVIGPQVRVQSGAIVEESVILGQTIIKERARVRRAIIDRGNVIEEEDKIGFDLRSDLSRFHVDDSSGIVVVPLAEYSQGLELWPAWPEPAMQSALRM
jgi:glucose-1-phosphate adenylyltransferase